MANESVEVGAEGEGQRIERWLLDRGLGLTRAAVHALLDEGRVRVNGRRARKSTRLRAGDRVELSAVDAALQPDPSIPLNVIHEDEHFVAVDKPAGMHCHPLRAGEQGTLANALIARYPEMAEFGGREAGLVHRIDRETSGLLLAGRRPVAYATLREAIASGDVDKQYLAICAGRFGPPRVLEAWLRGTGRRVMAGTQPFTDAREVALEVLSSRERGAHCELRLRLLGPGARHQIRAQLALAGHPIVGDALYGGPLLEGLDRHLLHASELRLRHPASGRPLTLAAPPPAVFERPFDED